jgi:hypothetical protein
LPLSRPSRGREAAVSASQVATFGERSRLANCPPAVNASAVVSRSDEELPPAALARYADSVERRRELARALHTEPKRARRITERLEELQVAIAQYRALAIDLHARLLELEPANRDQIAELRKRLIDSSVALEGSIRELVETPPKKR